MRLRSSKYSWTERFAQRSQHLITADCRSFGITEDSFTLIPPSFVFRHDSACALRCLRFAQESPGLLPPHALQAIFAKESLTPLIENEPRVGSTASFTRMIRRFHSSDSYSDPFILKIATILRLLKQLACLVAQAMKCIGSMRDWTFTTTRLHRRNTDPANIQEVVLQKLHAALYEEWHPVHEQPHFKTTERCRLRRARTKGVDLCSRRSSLKCGSECLCQPKTASGLRPLSAVRDSRDHLLPVEKEHEHPDIQRQQVKRSKGTVDRRVTEEILGKGEGSDCRRALFRRTGRRVPNLQ